MKRVINSLSVNLYGHPEKQAIVFVHGFPYDHTMWMNQINALKDDYFCAAYDVRGLGESYVGDGQYTMEAYVMDLFSVIEGLNLKKPVVCGLSMGGYITLRALEISQETFSAAILCDTRAEADSDKGKLVRAQKINQINVDGLRAFVESFVPTCFAEKSKEDLKELYNEIINRSSGNDPIGVKGALIAMLSRTSTKRFLKEIKIPTLVIAGEKDALTPPSSMKKMAEKIKGAKFKIVPKAGHMSPIENPSFVNDAIKGFLKKKVK